MSAVGTRRAPAGITDPRQEKESHLTIPNTCCMPEASRSASRRALTPDLLGVFWPTASARVVNTLEGCGVDPGTAEDAVAEAATRALARGLEVSDVDDFCRWLFVVSKNIAVDAARRSKKIVMVEEIPDRASAYDLESDVELRQQWHATADALTSLSEADRLSLLGELALDGAHTSRREAVKHAVRRHRARARLRYALGQVGAWIGGFRQPWNRAWPWTAAQFDRAGPIAMAALAGLLGLTAPAAPAAPAGVVPEGGDVGAAATPTAVQSSEAGFAAPKPHGALSGGARGGAAPPPSSSARLGPHQTGGVDVSFAVSPSYESDRTVFATGTHRSSECGDPRGMCPFLLKSTDGGRTWQQLRADGRGIGKLLLPPAYPRDPRMFSSGLALTVSSDGGETFKTVSAATGPAAMSPLFSDGDARILFGSDRALLVPTPTQHRDGIPGATPLELLLPQPAIPLQLWFSGEYARDQRVLVGALDVADVSSVVGAAPRVRSESVYSCAPLACERVLTFEGGGLLKSAWTSSRAVFVGDTYELHRSTDAGRSFAPVALPRRTGRDLLLGLSSSGSRLFATLGGGGPHRLYESADSGQTWRLISESDDSLLNYTVLPDGTLLDAPQGTSGFRCSSDGGRTWSPACGG